MASKASIPYKQIRAFQPSSDTIAVYQAYSVGIAQAAASQQRLDASQDFKVGRMTWIKPSFYWCMYRSGWSYKDSRQARILQITMKKEGLLTLLQEAALSSGPQEYVTETKGAQVRVQWDPERNVKLQRLDYRSLQLGISGEMVRKWIDEWIVRIDDITDDVRGWKGIIDNENENGDAYEKVEAEISANWPEEVFEVDEDLQERLRMKLIDDQPSNTHSNQ